MKLSCLNEGRGVKEYFSAPIGNETKNLKFLWMTLSKRRKVFSSVVQVIMLISTVTTHLANLSVVHSRGLPKKQVKGELSPHMPAPLYQFTVGRMPEKISLPGSKKAAFPLLCLVIASRFFQACL